MATNWVTHFLKCGVCSNHYSNPLMMPCLHSFCKKCLEQQLEEQGSSSAGGIIMCPTCDTISRLPSGGVSGLPSNLWLARQVELASYQHKIEEGKNIPCDRCVKRGSEAVVFCCNCCRFLCSCCKDDHQLSRDTIGHELVRVGEKGNEKAFNTIKIPCKPIMCRNHSDEKMKFFCEDCQCMVCRDCIVTKHKEHKQVDLEEVSEREKKDLSKINKELGNVFGTLEEIIASGEKMKQQINQRKKQVNEEITTAFKKIYSTLRDREQLLHDKNEEIASAKMVTLDMQLEEFGVYKQKVEFATQVASGAVDYTAAELLSTKKVIQQQLEDTLTTLKQLDMESAENDDIFWSVDAAPVVEQISKLGRVSSSVDPSQCTVEEGLVIPLATVGTERKIKVALRDSEGRVMVGKSPVSGKLENKASKSILQFKGTSNNGHASLSFVPEAVGEYELSIKVKNRAIGGSPYKIWVHTGRNYKSLSYSQPFDIGSSCYCVAVISNGCVYTTNSKNCIQVYNSDQHKIRTIGSSGSGVGQFSSPRGLTIIGDVLYVVDCGNHRVQKFTLTGEYLGQFGSLGIGEGQLSSPLGICSDGKGHILVADYNNKRVQVFSADGTFSCTISCSSEPYDVAVDNTGSIHVALYKENRIQVFSSNGDVVASYNGGGHINGPRSIAIDEKGYRFVTSIGSKELVVINPQGEQLSSYSIHQPYGVAIDTQGCVYVTTTYYTQCYIYKYL